MFPSWTERACSPFLPFPYFFVGLVVRKLIRPLTALWGYYYPVFGNRILS